MSSCSRREFLKLTACAGAVLSLLQAKGDDQPAFHDEQHQPAHSGCTCHRCIKLYRQRGQTRLPIRYEHVRTTYREHISCFNQRGLA